jgi:hypothetical protein
VKTYYIALGSLITMLSMAPAAAQNAHGGVPVRIPVADGVPSQCINGSTDRVWLTLRRLITSRNAGWFRKDNSVEVIINANVRTDPPAPKPLSFPLTTQVKFGDVPTGQVSVPIEYPIVSGLVLTQGDVSYTGLGVEITLLNMQGQTKLGSAIQALATITSSSKLPIPSSPYTQGLTYLLDFANTAITNDINANNKDDKDRSGALDFNFDPDGRCKGDFESTGTKAIVYSTGGSVTDDSYVDINHTDVYCWSADLTPTFSVKAAHIIPGKPCAEVTFYHDRYKAITNNYIGFYVNKRTTKKLGLGSDNALQRDRQESLKRCEANGFTVPAECPGGTD